MNYWILQSNPKYFRIVSWLSDFNWLGDNNLTDCWHISRYAPDVKQEEIAFIWKSKGNSNIRGIFGKAMIVPTPEKFPLIDQEEGYYIGEEGKAEAKRLENPNMATIAVKYTNLYLGNPLVSDDIEVMWKMRGFKTLNIIASPHRGIYRLDETQGKIIESMLSTR
jgi:hypothetical protein